MKLTHEDVRKLGELAALDLSEADIVDLFKDLEEVIADFEKLNDIEHIHIECPFNLNYKAPAEVQASLREDAPIISMQVSGGEFLHQAPQADGGYLMVPPVLDQD